MFAPRILALLAAGAAILPAAVSAEPVSISTISDDATALVRQATVQTSDLNLASAAGKQALRARVNHAISEVCSLNDVPDNFANAHCRQAASSDAKHQVADILSRSTPRFAQGAAPANTASGS